MRRNIPSTRALLAFVTAAKHQSFSRAAEELALTQSAVCRQIAQLEDMLGLKLFRRTRRGVKVTDAGLRYSRQIAAGLDSLERDTLQLISHGDTGGSIELAVVPTFASRWLIPRLDSFNRAHPTVSINLATRTRPFLFEETEFDAAIFAGSPTWPGAECHLLMQEEVIPVCAPALIAPRKKISPAQMKSFPLLQQTTRPYAWRQWFALTGMTVPNDMAGPRYELFSMLTQAAIHAQGIALIPRLLVKEELQEGSLVSPAPDLALRDRAYYFVHPEQTAENDMLHHFRTWLVAEAKNQ